MNKKNESRMERIQQKTHAGIMSKNFPEVEHIIINMHYKQKGVAKAIERTMNFYPTSYAFFRVDCLSDDCIDGGFDLTQVITSMIRNSRKSAKGELGCEDTGPRPDHSNIVYEVDIQYV